MAWKIFAREKFWVGKIFGGGNELGGPGGPPKSPNTPQIIPFTVCEKALLKR